MYCKMSSTKIRAKSGELDSLYSQIYLRDQAYVYKNSGLCRGTCLLLCHNHVTYAIPLYIARIVSPILKQILQQSEENPLLLAHDVAAVSLPPEVPGPAVFALYTILTSGKMSITANMMPYVRELFDLLQVDISLERLPKVERASTPPPPFKDPLHLDTTLIPNLFYGAASPDCITLSSDWEADDEDPEPELRLQLEPDSVEEREEQQQPISSSSIQVPVQQTTISSVLSSAFLDNITITPISDAGISVRPSPLRNKRESSKSALNNLANETRSSTPRETSGGSSPRQANHIEEEEEAVEARAMKIKIKKEKKENSCEQCGKTYRYSIALQHHRNRGCGRSRSSKVNQEPVNNDGAGYMANQSPLSLIRWSSDVPVVSSTNSSLSDHCRLILKPMTELQSVCGPMDVADEICAGPEMEGDEIGIIIQSTRTLENDEEIMEIFVDNDEPPASPCSSNGGGDNNNDVVDVSFVGQIMEGRLDLMVSQNHGDDDLLALAGGDAMNETNGGGPASREQQPGVSRPQDLLLAISSGSRLVNSLASPAIVATEDAEFAVAALDKKAVERGPNRADAALPIFYCSVCGKRFDSTLGRSRHFAEAHMNRRPYVCSVCKRRFRTSFQRNAHQRYTHASGGVSGVNTVYGCWECGLQMRSRKEIFQHMKSKHQGLAYICYGCNMVFVNHQSQRAHNCQKEDKFVRVVDGCSGDNADGGRNSLSVFSECASTSETRNGGSNNTSRLAMTKKKEFMGTIPSLPRRRNNSTVVAHCPDCGDEFSSALKLRNHRDRGDCSFRPAGRNHEDDNSEAMGSADTDFSSSPASPQCEEESVVIEDYEASRRQCLKRQAFVGIRRMSPMLIAAAGPLCQVSSTFAAAQDGQYPCCFCENRVFTQQTVAIYHYASVHFRSQFVKRYSTGGHGVRSPLNCRLCGKVCSEVNSFCYHIGATHRKLEVLLPAEAWQVLGHWPTKNKFKKKKSRTNGLKKKSATGLQQAAREISPHKPSSDLPISRRKPLGRPRGRSAASKQLPTTQASAGQKSPAAGLAEKKAKSSVVQQSTPKKLSPCRLQPSPNRSAISPRAVVGVNCDGGGDNTFGLRCHLCPYSFGDRHAALISHYALFHFRRHLQKKFAAELGPDTPGGVRVCGQCGAKVPGHHALINHLGLRHGVLKPLLPPFVWKKLVFAAAKARGVAAISGVNVSGDGNLCGGDRSGFGVEVKNYIADIRSLDPAVSGGDSMGESQVSQSMLDKSGGSDDISTVHSTD